MLSSSTDLDGLRRLRALKLSESNIGDKDRNSEDDERVRKTPGGGFLHNN
jgi:hypothetical protein